MKAMIFAAGLGTRFKPWTNKHPKALAVINGKSLLQRNIEYLQQYGIYEVVVNIHHFSEQVIEVIANNKGWGSNVIISDEHDCLLDTGGGLMKVKNHFTERFLTINADVLTDINLDKVIDYHQSHTALITCAVSDRKSNRCLLFNNDYLLCGWINHSTGEQKIVRQATELVSMAYNCIAVFEPTVFSLINKQGIFSLTDVFLSLAKNQQIRGFNSSEYKFIDVGKPESVAIAERLFP